MSDMSRTLDSELRQEYAVRCNSHRKHVWRVYAFCRRVYSSAVGCVITSLACPVENVGHSLVIPGVPGRLGFDSRLAIMVVRG